MHADIRAYIYIYIYVCVGKLDEPSWNKAFKIHIKEVPPPQ